MEYMMERTFERTISRNSNSEAVQLQFLDVWEFLGTLSVRWSSGFGAGVQVWGLLLRVLRVAVTYLRILKWSREASPIPAPPSLANMLQC